MKRWAWVAVLVAAVAGGSVWAATHPRDVDDIRSAWKIARWAIKWRKWIRDTEDEIRDRVKVPTDARDNLEDGR